jgi:hypothetical protein
MTQVGVSVGAETSDLSASRIELERGRPLTFIGVRD